MLQHPLELIVKLKPGHPSLLKRLEKLNNQQDSSTESDIDFASLLLESELSVSSLKGRIFNSANISFSEGSRMLNSPVRAGPLV